MCHPTNKIEQHFHTMERVIFQPCTRRHNRSRPIHFPIVGLSSRLYSNVWFYTFSSLQKAAERRILYSGKLDHLQEIPARCLGHLLIISRSSSYHPDRKR